MPIQSSAHREPLTAFSDDGKFLAVATADGRVTTFDTGTGAIVLNLAADGRLAGAQHRVHDLAGQSFEQHTAVCWVGQDGSNSATEPCLILGTAAGDVKACDAATGKLLWRASAVSAGDISALAWASAAGALFSAGADRQLVQLSLGSGDVMSRFDAGKQPLTALAVTPDACTAFAAGAAVVAWQPREQRRLFKFSGHPSAARSIAVTLDGSAAASAAAGERHVAVWQTASKPSKKTRPAAGILSLEHPAVSVTVATDSTSGGAAFFVAAVSEWAELYVWRCSPTLGGDCGGRRLHTSLLSRVMVGATRAERGQDAGILCAQLAGDSSGLCRVRIARSTWVRPTFETLSVAAPPGDVSSVTTVIPPQQGGLLLQGQGGTSLQAAAAQLRPVVARGKRSEEDGPLQLQGRTGDARDIGSLIAADSARRNKRRADTSIDTEEHGVLLDNATAMEASEAEALALEDLDDAATDDAASDAEPTLGEMVAEMQLRGRAATSQADHDTAAAEPPVAAAAPEGVVQADSLAVLLTQALRSEDRQLLERCLSVGDEAIVINSVQRLQPPDATAFLQAAVAIMIRKPQRAEQLIPWIRALVLAHTAFFITSPAARRALVSMHAAIDARCAHKDGLEALASRLELLEAHCPPAPQLPDDGSEEEDEDALGLAARQKVRGPEVYMEVGSTDEDEADGVSVEDDVSTDSGASDGTMGADGENENSEE